MIRIAQWNIHGGFQISDGETQKDVKFFIDKIKELNPDILLVQEGHISKDYSQVELLSNELNLPYYESVNLGESHLEDDSQLCLFVLSKHEITQHDFFEVTNPKLVSFNEKYGGEIKTEIFKKGFLSTRIRINKEFFNVISGHGHPFHIFEDSLENHPKLINEIQDYITKKSKDSKMILGCDLNCENIPKLFTKVFDNNIKLAFKKNTIYRKKQLDYIFLTDNFEVKDYKIDICTENHGLTYVDIEDTKSN